MPGVEYQRLHLPRWRIVLNTAKGDIHRMMQPPSMLQLTERWTLTIIYSAVMLTTLLTVVLIQRDSSHGQVCPVCPTADASPQSCTIRLPTVCMSESCRLGYIRHLQMEDVYPIPAIRHILWRNQFVPEYFVKQLRTWQRIHPNWTFVLWRDEDLEPFVATHFPDMLSKFKSLTDDSMRIHLFRYLILYEYGGTYADIDYNLVKSLDGYRRFHAVVTREPEAHSLQVLGMAWPLKLLANPAFMMAAPGHKFFHFAVLELKSRESKSSLSFAGGIGLSEIIEKFPILFPIAKGGMESIYLPPSHSFYPYPDNRINGSKSELMYGRLDKLNELCASLQNGKGPAWDQLRGQSQLTQYCTDVNNMDTITDRFQPVFAIYNLTKSATADGMDANKMLPMEQLTDMRRILGCLKFGSYFMNRDA